MIENQYIGKSAKEVWDEWDIDQRVHFMYDHDFRDSTLFPLDYFELPPNIQLSIAKHIDMGQYAHGGTIESAWKKFINWLNEEI